ncbi:MAG: hypothetical protein RMY16_10430 [Nostoc sp. DedQUE12b]|uniref:hypothetical protein n=1 Tax=Nostoc sp. DedQUE12b TaxID=3075398 RepID=UPI002AD37E29|nr:hypothetical protein [Nostoc sp. DedQUE12b]MDZ8085963.1 hypothetical protein [Nostoc sp. DedQUE12b]
MLDNIISGIRFFIPNRIDDESKSITIFKLALGTAVGFWLIAIAFATLTSFSQLVVEKFGSFEISNATIYIFIGVFFIWLTLTKIGTKKDDQQT